MQSSWYLPDLKKLEKNIFADFLDKNIFWRKYFFRTFWTKIFFGRKYFSDFFEYFLREIFFGLFWQKYFLGENIFQNLFRIPFRFPFRILFHIQFLASCLCFSIYSIPYSVPYPVTYFVLYSWERYWHSFLFEVDPIKIDKVLTIWIFPEIRIGTGSGPVRYHAPESPGPGPCIGSIFKLGTAAKSNLALLPKVTWHWPIITRAVNIKEIKQKQALKNRL